MTPPPNPAAQQAREAMQAYNAEVRPIADYYLTWPAQQRGVFCVAGQWHRNEAGDIEAWYTRQQLSEIIAVMDTQC